MNKCVTDNIGLLITLALTNMSIQSLRNIASQLVDEELNPKKLNQVINVLTSRKDKPQIEKIRELAKAGGNVGFFFDALNNAKIYSPTIVYRIIGRKTHGAYYRTVKKAEAKLKGENTYDIRKNNIYYKLALLLNKLVSQGKLPFKDEEGNDIYVTSDHCVLDDPVTEIVKLFKTAYGR